MLGEKLKQCRKKAGLSQEELSEKLSVSRQAITKWESNKGIPDIENLKNISRLFEVSIDYLINEDNDTDINFVIKEPIDINKYKKKGKFRSKYDVVVREKYSNAEKIYPLIRTKKLSLIENIIDFIGQPGLLEIADSLNDMSHYYLVELKNNQLLVKVTKEFIESREMLSKFTGKKKVIGSNIFRKVNYEI